MRDHRCRRRRSARGCATGQTVVIDDPVPARRLSAARRLRRGARPGCSASCRASRTTSTIAVIARGPAPARRAAQQRGHDAARRRSPPRRRPRSRTRGSTASCSGKADEIERLRQFSDSVVESLTDGLVVVDLDDRVLRWNRRMEALVGARSRGRRSAAGSPALLQPPVRRHAAGRPRASRPRARRSTACRSTSAPASRPDRCSSTSRSRRSRPTRRCRPAGSSCSRTSPIARTSRSSCGCRRRWRRSACSRPASRTK